MDVNRLSQGEKIAGASGIALFIIMFLAWFGAADNEFTQAIQAAGVDTTANAWQSFDFIDIILTLTVIAAIGMAALRASDSDVRLPLPASAVVTALGGLSTLLVLYRILDTPFDASRKYGVFLGLIAAAAVTYGGWRTMEEEGTTFSDAADGFSGGGSGGTGAGPGAGSPPPPPPPPPPSSGGTPPA